jgi:diguanylate cyclase (GGDEF)-like protein
MVLAESMRILGASIVGAELLADVARFLKSTFGRCDVVFRCGGDEFKVLLPQTTEEQAVRPVERRLRAIEFWNLSRARQYEMGFSWGIASYEAGSDVAEVLRRRMASCTRGETS